MSLNHKWTIEEAVELCTAIESVCPPFGCHVALTGGLLYKDGPRKDCDILFYRIRQVDTIDTAGLFDALEKIGLVMLDGWGWCFKFAYKRKPVDAFFPEEQSGMEYPAEETPNEGENLALIP